MASKFDICNMALTSLRANTISSFEESTSESEVCSIFYPAFVQDVFARHPWTFSLKQRQLSRDSTPPVNGYTYRYVIPAECVRLWALYDPSPVRDFDILEHYAHTNSTSLYAEYTCYVSESTWPGYFLQYVVAALASALAMPISDDTALAQYWHAVAYGTPQENEKGGMFAMAAGIDMQQRPQDKLPISDIVAARFT